MKANKWVYVLLVVAGIVMLYAGGFVLIDEQAKGISGLLIGIGSVMTVLGIGNFVHTLWIARPQNRIRYNEQVRHSSIEAKDERNIRIKEKAGWMMNIVTCYLLMALVVVFCLLGVDSMVLTVLGGVIAFQIIVGVLLYNHYLKTM